MKILSPSILSADFCRLGEQIELTAKGGAPYLHIDVMDGVFVPQISFGMPVLKSVRKVTDQVLDVHLMIRDPERYVEAFADCGADIITFHLESTSDPEAVITKIRQCGKKVGISIKPGTAVDAVVPYLGQVDMVLLMTVEPGFGGQKYLPVSTERIRTLRALIDENSAGNHVDLEVDGGINDATIDLVLEAGANVIVAGSSVFAGDILENTKKFNERLQTVGTE